jgi:hypothetical protein
MSGADDAAAALKAAAQASYKATFEAGSQFARAHTAVRQATDIVEVFARSIDLVVAAEALHAEADAAVKALRATLSSQMQDTGCTQVQGTYHAAHLAKKPAFLNIADEDAIPRKFFVQPPAQLDKTALKSALTDGVEQIPGVSLGFPNQMSLVLKARSKEAA